MNSLSSALNYYRDVLGIHHFLMPEGANVPQAETISQKPIIVVLVEGNELTKTDEEFFSKVLGAIQVRFADIQLVFREKLPTPQFEEQLLYWSELNAIFICLNHSLFQAIRDRFPGQLSFELPHPSLMQQDPTLKRPAWETLKQLKKHLDLDPRKS